MPRLVPHVQSSALLSVVLISIAAREPGIRLTFCIKSVFVPVSAGRQRVWKISLLSIINMEVVCVCVCVRERERENCTQNGQINRIIAETNSKDVSRNNNEKHVQNWVFTWGHQ